MIYLHTYIRYPLLDHCVRAAAAAARGAEESALQLHLRVDNRARPQEEDKRQHGHLPRQAPQDPRGLQPQQRKLRQSGEGIRAQFGSAR